MATATKNEPVRKLKQSAQAKRATLSQWRSRREKDVTLPSGTLVRLRPINLERHALEGGLPAKLRELAGKGSAAVNDVIEAADGSDGSAIETRDYLDSLIRAMVLEPELPADVDLDEIITPVDYHFLVRVAMREVSYDAAGEWLWGEEPVTRWERFREEHGCDEDCEACDRLRIAVSEAD